MSLNTADILHPLPDWARFVMLPVAGALAQSIWARYRRRLTTLRWSVQYQPMAFATEDFGWGKVDILYNGAPTQNLHIASVQIQNASSNDLQGLRIDVLADVGTSVLRSSGQIRGSLQFLPFAGDYAAVLDRASRGELTAIELTEWKRRSPFSIPVLNREHTAELKLLIARNDYQTPVVTVSVEHLGVRLEHEPPAQLVFGVRVAQAVLVGVILGLFVIALALQLGISSWQAALIAWSLGALAQSIGALFVRLVRSLVKVAD